MQEPFRAAVWCEGRTTPTASACCLLAGHVPPPKGLWTLLSSHPLRPGHSVRDAQEGANPTGLKQSLIYCRKNRQKHRVKTSFPFALWESITLPARTRAPLPASAEGTPKPHLLSATRGVLRPLPMGYK